MVIPAPAGGTGPKVLLNLQRMACHFKPPRPGHPISGPSQERIKRRRVPGGLINEYKRAA